MSRIDEALNRVRVSGGHGSDLSLRRRLDLAEAQPVLESYAAESASAPIRAEQPDELPVLSVVAPRGGKGRQLGPFDPGVEGKLVVSDKVSTISVEQYRRLAAALHELQMERALKTLMVTSALPNDGKTLTIANLALTLSESYDRRVLLIDGDLRRPSVHAIFRLPNASGLSDVLRSDRHDIPLLEVSGQLSVLPAGRTDGDPMAALTSDRMRKVLDQFSTEFDWVLLDAPPIGFIPDAQLLARLTGAVLFVIGAGSTPYPLVARAIAELGPECVVGTVLNRVEGHNIPATDYYEGYYARSVD